MENSLTEFGIRKLLLALLVFVEMIEQHHKIERQTDENNKILFH